jgi:hypothetical protein
MTREDLRQLNTGDIVRSSYKDRTYTVTANYGTRVTAVDTVDITNHDEWTLVAKASHQYKVPR